MRVRTKSHAGSGHHARRRRAAWAGSANGAPLTELDVELSAEVAPSDDDGGSPRLQLDPVSGRPVLSWEYEAGGGLLEASGLSVGPAD